MAALQNINKKAGQTMQQAVQAASHQIKTQSTEIYRSAAAQTGLPIPLEQGVEKPSKGHPSIVQNLQSQGTNLNVAEIHRREQELLAIWRTRLEQIKSGIDVAGQERVQSLENWKKQQDELMRGDKEDSQSKLVMPQGKPKGPMAQSGKAQVKTQIDMKHETGRGAKN